MKRMKTIPVMMLVAVMTVCMFPTASTYAISKQRKANHAYAKALKKGKIDKFTQYDLRDVTGDGVKELIIKNKKGKTESARQNKVYNYKKGKVKKILSLSGSAIAYNKKYRWISKLNHLNDEGIKFTMYQYNGKKIVKKAVYQCVYSRHKQYGSEGEWDYVTDGETYYKTQKGKKTKISKKKFNSATDYDYDIYPGTEATKKQLIKKLSK